MVTRLLVRIGATFLVLTSGSVTSGARGRRGSVRIGVTASTNSKVSQVLKGALLSRANDIGRSRLCAKLASTDLGQLGLNEGMDGSLPALTGEDLLKLPSGSSVFFALSDDLKSLVDGDPSVVREFRDVGNLQEGNDSQSQEMEVEWGADWGGILRLLVKQLDNNLGWVKDFNGVVGEDLAFDEESDEPEHERGVGLVESQTGRLMNVLEPEGFDVSHDIEVRHHASLQTTNVGWMNMVWQGGDLAHKANDLGKEGGVA